MSKEKQSKTACLEIENSLSIFDAVALHEKILKIYKTSDKIEIEFKNLTDCDTSGAQLLYSLKKSSLKDGKELIFKDISGEFENCINRMRIPFKLFSQA